MKSFSGVSPIQLFLVSDEECMSVEVLYGLMSHNFSVPLLYFPNLFGCMNLSGFLALPPFPTFIFHTVDNEYLRLQNCINEWEEYNPDILQFVLSMHIDGEPTKY